MIEYTLFNVIILELKIYCGPDKFYGRSKFGRYDEVKNRAPLSCLKIEVGTSFFLNSSFGGRYLNNCFKFREGKSQCII